MARRPRHRFNMGPSWQPGAFLEEQTGEGAARIMSELEEAVLNGSGGRGPLLAASKNSCNVESIEKRLFCFKGASPLCQTTWNPRNKDPLRPADDLFSPAEPEVFAARLCLGASRR